MRFDGKNDKRKITKFTLDELSAVPKGAQKPAKMAIIKISANEKQEVLESALRQFMRLADNAHLWVYDYDDSHIVFHHGGSYYAIGYGIVGNEIQFDGEPEPTRRDENWVTSSGEKLFKGNCDPVEYALVSAGFSHTDATVMKGAVRADEPLDDQIAVLATQFGKEVTASVGGEAHPASDFAYVPDAEKPSTWKLPIFDAAHVSAAVAALGEGYRGKKVSIPTAERDKVLATVRAAYGEHYPDKPLPTVLEKAMADKDLQKQLDDATAQIAELEVLAKMSDAEKAAMDKMSDEEKTAWMAMTADERKAKMKTAKEADESFDMPGAGTIRKSEVGDPVYVMLKMQHDQIVASQEREAMSAARDLVKAMCPNLPGTEDEKANAIRKAKGTLSAAEFETLEKALKAGDAAMAGRLEPVAHGTQDVSGGTVAKEKFDAGIKEIMDAKQITKSAAMQTEEGRRLAKELRESQETE